jgi:hypothetical protein
VVHTSKFCNNIILICESPIIFNFAKELLGVLLVIMDDLTWPEADKDESKVNCAANLPAWVTWRDRVQRLQLTLM